MSSRVTCSWHESSVSSNTDSYIVLYESSALLRWPRNVAQFEFSSSLFTISGRQLKHTKMNRQMEIRQKKYTKCLTSDYQANC